ncbi:MAG: hypothetical protein IID46_05685 [Planctomycetes bacterium]|nr:hypothetical protein [Planctomycetota bacterium]
MSVGLSDPATMFESVLQASEKAQKLLFEESLSGTELRYGGRIDCTVLGFRSWAGKLEFKVIDVREVSNVLRRKKKIKPPTDLQSGFIHRSTVECDQAAYAIRAAHQHLSPEDAVETIGTIWESLEKTGQLAEARTRICLGKLKEPQLAERPAWLAEQLQDLSQADEDLAPSHPLAIEAADRVIRACLHLSTAEIEAKVQKAPLGNVLVGWDVEPHSLQWEVEAARLPWPGVKINALVVDNSGDKPQAHTRIFHTAFEVIGHFSEQLHEFDV